jgi:ABC-2 type transport system permease protein
MNIKSITSLTSILSKNSEMKLPEKTGYKVLALIAVSCIMIPCTVIVGFISYVMTEALLEAGSPGGGMLFEMQILSAFSMIFGILVIFSVLFFSSDREHFVTLPIPAHHLMMGKFLYAYFAESVMEFLVLIAVFLGYFLAIGKNISVLTALNPISIIAAILGVALIPLVPMIYCAIFSLILMAVLKGVKDSKIFYRMSTVFLLIFAGIFVYSLRGIGEINMENYVESLGSGQNLLLRTLNIIFFPVPWLSNAISDASIMYLLLYIVGNAALLGILYFLGKALYQTGLYTAASLGSSKKADVKASDIKLESQFKASFMKELRVILRTKAFSGNCAYINILWPAGTAALFHFTKDKAGMASFIEMYQSGRDRADMILIMAVLGISFIATALNSLASTAFTREGQHLSLIKFIPVPYDIQMYAKAFLSFIFTYPAILLTDIIICIYMKAPFYIGVFYAIIMFLAHVLSIIIGMMMDSSSPYVEWDDEYSALRGNLNTFFNMAIMMLLSIIFIVLGLLLYELLKLPILVYYLVVLVSLTIITVRMFIVGKRQILINMERL